MQTILITALVVVLLVGIPLAIFIGRASKPKPQHQPGQNPQQPGQTPQQPQHQPGQNAQPAATRFWNTKVFQWGLGIIILILILIGGIFLIKYLMGLLPADTDGGDTTSVPFDWRSLYTWLPIDDATWMFIVGILLIGGLLWALTSKKIPKLLKWVAVIVTLLVFFPGFGLAVVKYIKMAERCVATQDCGPRADEIPIIRDGGTVDVPVGGNIDFYAEGEVVLKNRVDYCLDISPRGRFKIWWNENIRRVHIKAYSGMREYVSVTSIPISDPRCGG